MNLHDIHAVARAARQSGGQLIIKPMITTRQRRGMADLEARIAMQQPASEASMADADALVPFGWGWYGMTDFDPDWVMVDG
jgi:hypothetical protein